MLAAARFAFAPVRATLATAVTRSSRVAAPVAVCRRFFSTEHEDEDDEAAEYRPPHVKIAVLGAGGGIGQPLSLLLSTLDTSFATAELSLYDIKGAKGVAADCSHINSTVVVKGFDGEEELKDALEDVNLVLIPAGVPRKPGMTRDDLFNTNASIVMNLAKACATHCPKAVVGIIANPVNSTVPIAAETYKRLNCFDPKKILGVCSLDMVRAQRFIYDMKKDSVAGLEPLNVELPVIGGHSGVTILPILSQAQATVDTDYGGEDEGEKDADDLEMEDEYSGYSTQAIKFDESEIAPLTERIQNAGTEVVDAKAGAGSATLSMAHAAKEFAEAVMHGMAYSAFGEGAQEGEEQDLEGMPSVYAYTENNDFGTKYFAAKCYLDGEGVHTIEQLQESEFSAFEQEKLKEALPELKKNVAKGEEFVAQHFE